MMWGYYGPNAAWMGWGMALSMLFWVALLAVIIWGILRIARSASARDRSAFPAPPTDSAEEILRQRYARGEIDASTFEAMRERLRTTAQQAQQLSAPHV